MREYFRGYYCRDDIELQVLNKNSNRDILEALMAAHPSALSGHDLAAKTGLPIKTIYSQINELYREFFTAELSNRDQPQPRGRPPEKKTKSSNGERDRSQFIIESVSPLFDVYEGKQKGKIPLPPGHVEHSNEFGTLWANTINADIVKLEEDLCTSFLHFLETVIHSVNKLKELAPSKGFESCCYQCGVNHEARDLLRAISIHVIDELETSKPFVELLWKNELITKEAYDHALKGASKIESTYRIREGIQQLLDKFKNSKEEVDRKISEIKKSS